MSKENVASGKKRKGAGCLRWLGRVVIGGVILLLGLAIIGAIYQGIASARDAKLYKPIDQMVDVNGIQMRLDCRGSGSPTVILEAGGQSSSIVWAQIQDEVAGFTRVCSYDRAGYGWSDSTHETMYPDQVADMLHTLLENGGEAPPYLMVGHSFGGIYIRIFTEKYPDEVVGMVLVDSSHEAQSQQAPPEITKSPDYLKTQKAGTTSLQVLKLTAPIGLLRIFKMMEPAVESLQLPDQERGPALAELNRTSFVGAYARESDMMTIYSGQPKKLGDMPLIVLSQKMDLIDMQEKYELYPPAIQSLMTTELMQREVDTYNENQNELTGLSTRGKQIVVEDSGHFIQIDQPQVVIDAIREVFEQVSR